MTLTAEGVSVRFGGVHALEDVTVRVRPAAVTGLIGPNGAGKSTFINCLTGFVRPQAGRVAIDDLTVTGDGSDARVARGIARSFQRPRIDPQATVRDTLRVACYRHTRARLLGTLTGTVRRRREEREVGDRVERLIDDFEFGAVADAATGQVAVWQLRLLEVARVTAMAPRYMLLDEPAAGLDDHERDLLASHIARVVEEGSGVLLVEHNFAFVARLCSTVSVLDRGRLLAEGTPEEIRRDARVIDAYLGSTDDSVA